MPIINANYYHHQYCWHYHFQLHTTTTKPSCYYHYYNSDLATTTANLACITVLSLFM